MRRYTKAGMDQFPKNSFLLFFILCVAFIPFFSAQVYRSDNTLIYISGETIVTTNVHEALKHSSTEISKASPVIKHSKVWISRTKINTKSDKRTSENNLDEKQISYKFSNEHHKRFSLPTSISKSAIPPSFNQYYYVMAKITEINFGKSLYVVLEKFSTYNRNLKISALSVFSIRPPPV